MQLFSTRFHIVVGVFFIATILPVSVRSDVPATSRHEILHLLEFIRSSDCVIERNGERYDGENAYSHVRKKYEYFKGKIRSSEDFIAYSASKSTISGECYRVFCGNEPDMRTQEWLLEELHRYRDRSNQ